MPTYYVNFSAPVNGASGLSWGDAWNTFASLPVLVAGDVVEIRSGTMPTTFTLGQSGSAGNPITFRGDPTQVQTQRITLPTEGGNNIILSSRSNIVWENLEVEGLPQWTNQSTVAFSLAGAMSNIVFRNVRCRYARFDFSGGFAITNVLFDRCTANDCRSDGVRSFSTIAAYTHSDIRFIGCEFSRNGKAQGANGAGISFLVQDTHVSCTYADILISGCVIEDNYRAGIALVGTGVAWATLIAAGNTTPPDQRYQGTRIVNNQVRRNGGAGLHILGHKASANNRVRIAWNTVEDCGENTTIGGIWTGGCLQPLIERNTIKRSKSNGTVVGDGQGIFDDQWNDGAVVRNNYISDGVFQAFNPEYTAYGIGIYRCSNSKHYGNVIVNCRHGFFCGYVAGATAPVMAGIVVNNNTFIRILKTAIVLDANTPAGAFNIRNNFVLVADRDVEAQSGAAGNQTWGTNQNVAISVATKYTGNNVGAVAFDHTRPTSSSTANGLPTVASALLTDGADLGFVRDVAGKQGRKFIGAYASARMRRPLGG